MYIYVILKQDLQRPAYAAHNHNSAFSYFSTPSIFPNTSSPSLESTHSPTMNSIRAVRDLNKAELEKVVDPSASWHRDYADTAYVYIGGLPLELSEGDILTIFSQYGEPTYLNLVRDKETGKSRGFCFLKYEDQRSTDLAVDNLGGSTVMGRVLKVDHTRYKRKEGEDEEVERARELKYVEPEDDEEESEEERRPMLKEEIELAKLIREHNDDDPMKEYLVTEKKEEVAQALRLSENGTSGDRKRTHHHRHHRGDRDGRDGGHRKHRHQHHYSRRSKSP